MLKPAQPAQQDGQLRPACSPSAVNLRPNPTLDLECLTTASARICPSCTRKCNLAWTPSSLDSGVSMNKPPMLMSRTRETSSRPWQRQYTQTSLGAGTRDVNLLDGKVAGREEVFPGTMI